MKVIECVGFIQFCFSESQGHYCKKSHLVILQLSTKKSRARTGKTGHKLPKVKHMQTTRAKGKILMYKTGNSCKHVLEGEHKNEYIVTHVTKTL